jgi:hypothetical protein
MPYFYKRAVILLTVLSLLMFAMLTAALVSWREHKNWQAALVAVSGYEAQTAVLENEATAYQALVGRLGWTPATELRREMVDLTALFRGSELGKINQMLAVTYTGQGFFALNRFSIEDAGAVGSTQGEAATVRVTLNGENVLLVEKRR